MTDNRRRPATTILLMLSLLTGGCCISLPNVPPKTLVELPRSGRAGEAPVLHDFVWRDSGRERDVPVRIYAPAAAQKAPVVIFSHGIGEDRASYAWLGDMLARAGFVTVHITHAGTDRAMLERGYRHLYNATKRPINWINRVQDVSFVIDRLGDVPLADPSRVVVAGHSAGAFTAFAVAGLRLAGGEEPRDERVRAIIPMSMPRMDAVVASDGYAGVRVPVLNVTGTCDTSLLWRTFPRHRRIPFDSARGPNHFLVTLRGVNHNTFSNSEDEHHAVIGQLTIAFLRAFVLGDQQAKAWFDDPGRTRDLTLEVTGNR